jgi:hypothetical protein
MLFFIWGHHAKSIPRHSVVARAPLFFKKKIIDNPKKYDKKDYSEHAFWICITQML